MDTRSVVDVGGEWGREDIVVVCVVVEMWLLGFRGWWVGAWMLELELWWLDVTWLVGREQGLVIAQFTCKCYPYFIDGNYRKSI